MPVARPRPRKDEDDGDDDVDGQMFVIVHNPEPSDATLGRRLSRGASNKVTAATAPEQQAMDRDGTELEATDAHAGDADAPAATRIVIPSSLKYDYFQAQLCGPHKPGLRLKVRRKVPKHLRVLGVTNAAWLRWMDELAKVQVAEPYPSMGTMPPYIAQERRNGPVRGASRRAHGRTQQWAHLMRARRGAPNASRHLTYTDPPLAGGVARRLQHRAAVLL